MELDVKSIVPEPRAWSGKEVTHWALNILLADDQNIWDMWKDLDLRYYPVSMEEHYTLYVAQDQESGLADYLIDDAHSHEGFGGREFKLQLHDGSEVTLIGPWSSNSAIVNAAVKDKMLPSGFTFVKEVSIYSNGSFRNVGLASNIQVPKLQELIEEFLGQGWHLAWGSIGDTNTYIEIHASEPGRCRDQL